MNTPIAIAWPLHATSIGAGNESIRYANSKPMKSIFCASGAPALSTFRSKPPQNTPGLPVNTTTARSDTARSNASLRADSIAIDITLTLPSSIVMVATESLSSYVRGVVIELLLRARLRIQHDVVDQARFAHAGRDGDEDWTIERRMTCERFGVDRFDVFNFHTLGPLQHASRGKHYFLGAAKVGAMLVASGANREAQRERVLTLGRREVGVARAHREAVFLAHDRHRHNLDIEVQIADHFLNRAQLLKILLAEDRQVRFDDVEQLGDHRRHPAEMARAMRAAQTIRDVARVDRRLRVRRVHCSRLRREDDVDRHRLEHRAVALEVARIAREVLAGSKLGRIDEYRRDQDRRLATAFAHQRQMAVVQKAHRRHQRDSLAIGASALGVARHFVGRGDDDHREALLDSA